MHLCCEVKHKLGSECYPSSASLLSYHLPKCSVETPILFTQTYKCSSQQNSVQYFCNSWLIIPPAQQSCWGGILVSLRLSVCSSILITIQLCFSLRRPSVPPSVRPAFRVRSVAPTVLVRSISYLWILSSSFRRCVVCIISCKISKFEFLAIFLNFVTLTCFDLGSDVNH